MAGGALPLVHTRPDHTQGPPILGALVILLMMPSTGRTLREQGIVLHRHVDHVMDPSPGPNDPRSPRQPGVHFDLPLRVSVYPTTGI